MLKIMDRVELKDETAILPNPCYVQCGDNLELLKSQPNESGKYDLLRYSLWNW